MITVKCFCGSELEVNFEIDCFGNIIVDMTGECEVCKERNYDEGYNDAEEEEK